MSCDTARPRSRYRTPSHKDGGQNILTDLNHRVYLRHPGYSDTGGPIDTGTLPPTPSVDTSGSGGTPGTPGTGPTSSGGIDTGTGGGFSAPALASAPKTSKLSPAPRNADAAPIGFFGGLSAGLIVLALAGAGLIGFGLIRLCLGGLNPAAMTICPLEPPS